MIIMPLKIDICAVKSVDEAVSLVLMLCLFLFFVFKVVVVVERESAIEIKSCHSIVNCPASPMQPEHA